MKLYHHNNAMLIMIVVLFTSMIATIPDKTVPFTYPNGWPKPVYDFAKNPRTVVGFQLGKDLFFDPILSDDNTISCGSCHLSFTAFTHADHRLSHGIKGRIGTRNTSTLINLAWNTSFMWDGGVNNIEVQAINPITNPLEMDSDLGELIDKLQNSSDYPKRFYEVYNDSVIDSKKLLKALAQFTVSLTSFESKYDSVSRGESGIKFTQKEANGYELFKTHCATCHEEPLFTNNSFKNNGLAVDTFLNDSGRMGITKNSEDAFKFRVPTLRNIEHSAPYFHDGRVNRLKDVLKHYTSEIQHSSTLAPELKDKINLTRKQQIEIVAFLKTLTDKQFLYNMNYRQTNN